MTEEVEVVEETVKEAEEVVEAAVSSRRVKKRTLIIVLVIVVIVVAAIFGWLYYNKTNPEGLYQHYKTLDIQTLSQYSR